MHIPNPLLCEVDVQANLGFDGSVTNVDIRLLLQKASQTLILLFQNQYFLDIYIIIKPDETLLEITTLFKFWCSCYRFSCYPSSEKLLGKIS